MGDMVVALKNYRQGLKLFESINELEGIAISLNNVGYVLQNMAEFNSALEYYKRGYELKKSLRDSSGMGLSLSNIASTYEFLKQPKKAIASYLEAIRLQSLIGDFFGIGWFGVNLFFMLSGFVLYLPFVRGRNFSVKQFYVRRVQRLYPMLMICGFISISFFKASHDSF